MEKTHGQKLFTHQQTTKTRRQIESTDQPAEITVGPESFIDRPKRKPHEQKLLAQSQKEDTPEPAEKTCLQIPFAPELTPPSPFTSDAVQPLSETAFLHEGRRLSFELSVKERTGYSDQDQRSIRRDLRVSGLGGPYGL